MDVESIRNTPLFAGLTEAEQALIANAFRPETRAKGTIIYSSGKAADVLYLLESGFVRLLGENGVALATLGPGSLLGETEFLRGSDHVMGAVAAGDVRLWGLTDQALRRLFRQHPEVGVALSRVVGEQVVQMEDYLVDRLAATDLLGDLPQNLLRALAVRLYPQEVERGSVLYRPGEQPRSAR